MRSCPWPCCRAMTATLCVFALSCAGRVVPAGAAGPDATLADAARRLDRQLREQVLPFWYDTAQDREHGGYALEAGSKQLVGQSRMIWGFSHAHRQGWSTPERDYLQAARQGFAFLQQHFLDPEHGGYYWMTDAAGQATNRHKMIYGQAFVIYGLVEYYRASRDEAALQAALEQFLTLQRHARDPAHGGWFEHFTPDWTPVMAWQEHVSVEVPGYKSANAHLHLMEALTELYRELPDERVRDALAEAVHINVTHFYPRDPAQSAFHCRPNWTRVTDESSRGLSYGHNVEFAWLLLYAQDALGVPRSWDHFYAHLDHALKYGFDQQDGGLYSRGVGNEPAVDRDKVWWAQAELLAALSVGLPHERRAQEVAACEKLLGFLERRMIDPQDGIWTATVAADGTVRSPSKKNHWKANYHDVRGMVMFIRSQSEGGKTP